MSSASASWRSWAAVTAVIACSCVATAPAGAVCIVGSGVGTCTEAALTACLPGGSGFDGSVAFNCGGAATIVFTAEKVISANTSIDGAGLVTLSGNDKVRLFQVEEGITLSLDNLTVTRGFSGGQVSFTEGGAVANFGTLNVTRCRFSDNTAHASGAPLSSVARARGGAISSVLGSLTISDSTFIGNTAFGAQTLGNAFGGAVANVGGGATITGSTFVGNTAAMEEGADDELIAGGAIYQSGPSSMLLAVVNSTITDNAVSGTPAHGGGIYAGRGIVGLTNCTVRQSTSSSLYSDDAVFLLVNTIIAGAPTNCEATVFDGGYNIEDGTSCAFRGTGCSDTGGTSYCNTNPLLDPAGLANNGGPTQTMALCSGAGSPAGCSAASPAINAGNQSVCADPAPPLMMPPVNNLDQRGFTRPGGSNANCCIGAFEVDGGLPVDTPTATPTTTPTGTPTSTPTATSTATPTSTATSTPTATPTATSSSTRTATPTGTSTTTPTATPSQAATSSPTGTPSSTHSPAPQANGARCAEPGHCQSHFCADGVCCDTACNGPFQQCSIPGSTGICVEASPAPALDRWGLVFGILLLGGVAAIGLRRGTV
jgi:hypothetical protein